MSVLKVTLVLLVTLFSSYALAARLQVIGVRSQSILDLEIAIDPAGISLGELTDRTLRAAPLTQYTGSTAGVTSINGLGSALEVLSDTDMNAYGWCYRVDGVESGLLADQYVLTGRESRIEWFYAYARMEKSRWTAMCVPADHLPAQGERATAHD